MTDAHAQLIARAVESSQLASASEGVRTALRKWASDEEFGRLWDQGIAGGLPDTQLTTSEIKAEGMARRKRRAK